jgi:hypothetical protein
LARRYDRALQPHRLRHYQACDITIDDKWHTWRCLWDTTGLTFYEDYVDSSSVPYWTVAANSIDNWHFNDPGMRMFLLLNQAIGGSGGGSVTSTRFPSVMLVDWVRVW